MSDSYPACRYEMLRAGYTSLFQRKCSRCGTPIERMRTTRGKEITVDRGETDYVRVELHRCSHGSTARLTGLDGQLRTVFETNQLTALVAVDHEGKLHWLHSNLADAEDTRNNLITAANQVRISVRAKREAIHV